MKFKNTLTEKSSGWEIIDKIARAVTGKKFMDVGEALKSLGFKESKDYFLNTEPPAPPVWLLTYKGGKIAIVNKKNAEKPEKIIGELAIGWVGRH